MSLMYLPAELDVLLPKLPKQDRKFPSSADLFKYP